MHEVHTGNVPQAETTRKSLAVLLATTLPLSTATVEASLLRLVQLLRGGTTSDLLSDSRP